MQCLYCLELSAAGAIKAVVCPVCGTDDAKLHVLDVCKDVPLEPIDQLAGVSGRHGFAHRFAEWLEANELKPARQCIVERSETKRYYRIGWSIGLGELGGEVHIYNEEWIQVKWDGDVEWMPPKGSRIFDLDMFAQQFMVCAFLDRNWDRATMIPERQTKRNRDSQ